MAKTEACMEVQRFLRLANFIVTVWNPFLNPSTASQNEMLHLSGPIKVTGYRSGRGYLSLCNGELWQHTDRQHYQTYIILQRSTYLMHTARTESLPRASRATDAVEIREFL